MSKKNVIARVGNFEITKDGGSEHEYLRIKTVSGDWGVMYRDDSEMYGKLMTMIRDKEYEKTLELHVLHLFYTTTILIDQQFALDFVVALEALRDRMAKAAKEPTEEEETEAIKEAEVMEDMQKLASELGTDVEK